jgi:hypothetical protein
MTARIDSRPFGNARGAELMFASRRDARRSKAIHALKAAARTLFEAAEGDAVLVNEPSCTEPGCPPASSESP